MVTLITKVFLYLTETPPPAYVEYGIDSPPGASTQSPYSGSE